MEITIDKVKYILIPSCPYCNSMLPIINFYHACPDPTNSIQSPIPFTRFRCMQHFASYLNSQLFGGAKLFLYLPNTVKPLTVPLINELDPLRYMGPGVSTRLEPTHSQINLGHHK